MILKFKIFENKETILNIILDKIQEYGKNSLSSDELNFLKEYPNGKLEISDKKETFEKSSKRGEKFHSENFEFEFLSSDFDEISNSFIISGVMYFKEETFKTFSLNGYFLINQETHQIFPYFQGPNDETAFDYASGHEEEFYDFLEEIYEKKKK